MDMNDEPIVGSPNNTTREVERWADKFVQAAGEGGLGVTMALLAAGEGGEGVTLSLKAELPPFEVQQLPTSPSAHLFNDLSGFADYVCNDLGGEGRPIILVQLGQAWATRDDAMEVGARRIARLSLPISDEYAAWQTKLEGDGLVDHRAMVLFIRRWEHTLAPASLSALEQLASVGAMATVKHNSDIASTNAGYAIEFRVAANDKLATIPREIYVSVPVFEGDEKKRDFTVRIVPQLPETPDAKLKFQLVSSDFARLARDAETEVCYELASACAQFEESEAFLVTRGTPFFDKHNAHVRDGLNPKRPVPAF